MRSHAHQNHYNVRPAFFYTKALDITQWLFVWSWSNFFIIWSGSINSLCGVSKMDVQNFLRFRRIKNALLYIPYLLVLVMTRLQDIVMSLRLCGIGVALLAETELGWFRTDRTCRSGHKHVKKSCPKWDSKSTTSRLWGKRSNARLAGDPIHAWSVFNLCAKCDNSVYSQ